MDMWRDVANEGDVKHIKVREEKMNMPATGWSIPVAGRRRSLSLVGNANFRASNGNDDRVPRENGQFDFSLNSCHEPGLKEVPGGAADRIPFSPDLYPKSGQMVPNEPGAQLDAVRLARFRTTWPNL
jgi:hypothetical protein